MAHEQGGSTDPVSGAVDAIDVSEARTAEEVELFGAERVTFFSDAVIAIAITLLAIDLPLPDSARHEVANLHFLHEHRSEFIGLLITFVVIAANWLATTGCSGTSPGCPVRRPG